MKGIDFLVDEDGNRSKVLIDLEQWGDLWEDFYDALLASERAAEPSEAWDEVKRRLEDGL